MKIRKNILLIMIIISIITIGLLIFLYTQNTITDNDNILVKKITYEYPYKESMIILNNGIIKKSIIVDELTVNGLQKDEYKKIGKLTKNEKEELNNILENMKNQELKNSSFSTGYGISVKINDTNTLYSAEYFEQSDIDNLNTFIIKILTK